MNPSTVGLNKLFIKAGRHSAQCRTPTIVEMDNSPGQLHREQLKNPKRSWDQYYHELLDFINEHGHSSIPPSKRGLHRWTRSQRYEYALLKKGRDSALKRTQIEKLETAQFVWSIQDDNWEKMYRQLQEFISVHGHCVIPYNRPEYSKLRSWLYVQKRMINDTSKFNKNQEKVERLMELSIEPITRRTKWELLLTAILEYKATHPQSKTIPEQYVTNNMKPLGRQFHYLKGQWKQHSSNQPHRLTNLQIQQLQQIAIDFLVSNSDANTSEAEQNTNESPKSPTIDEAKGDIAIQIVTINGVVSMDDWMQDANPEMDLTHATIPANNALEYDEEETSVETDKKPSAKAVDVDPTTKLSVDTGTEITELDDAVVGRKSVDQNLGNKRIARRIEYVKEKMYVETIVRNSNILWESSTDGDYLSRMLAQLKRSKKEASDEIVVTIGSDTVTCYDLCTLKPGTYLNDAVIQCFLRLVDEQRISLERKSRERMALFNTHFCAKLNPEHFTAQVKYV